MAVKRHRIEETNYNLTGQHGRLKTKRIKEQKNEINILIGKPKKKNV